MDPEKSLVVIVPSPSLPRTHESQRLRTKTKSGVPHSHTHSTPQ